MKNSHNSTNSTNCDIIFEHDGANVKYNNIDNQQFHCTSHSTNKAVVAFR